MTTRSRATIRLILGGDVMAGRGIDQVLPHPSDPVLYESFVKSAADYVNLAESVNGAIAAPVPFDYIWGDALGRLARAPSDVRIVNLETAVTRADHPWPKGINYRMNPANVGCLTAARITCCVLANNHVLDWGRDGLLETLDVLRGAGLQTVGAGHNATEAAAPAVMPIAGKGRVLLYAFACPSSGVPDDWAAGDRRPGVNFLSDTAVETAQAIATQARADKQPDDIVVCSFHWGPNWGYDVDPRDRAFALALIESGEVAVVYGHSSHHPKAIEVHCGKPIFYGCGDLLNDYEGIGAHARYRDDLVFMYAVEIVVTGAKLASLGMVPFRIRNFRLTRADRSEVEWLEQTMRRECRRFGGDVAGREDGVLTLLWR